MYSIIKEKFIKYFVRILLFIIVFHVIIRPVQSAINKDIISPIISNELIDIGSHFKLQTIKNQTLIYSKTDDQIEIFLKFSIPFGQFYFFLIFFLWFKPSLLMRALFIYNIILIPAYSLAVFMFLKGFEIFGYVLVVNEKIFRLIYFFILSLKILRPKQFQLIFSN